MNSDGTERFKVDGSTGIFPQSLVFSVDGQNIGFTGSYQSNSGLFVTNLDGSNVKRIAEDGFLTGMVFFPQTEQKMPPASL
jgi:hypothetical protein